MPLKDIVDQVYSVYFFITSDPALAPTECSVLREPWTDDNLDAYSTEAVTFALRILATTGGTWGSAKGLKFMPQGVLKTPWGPGKWGVLADGRVFADFGGGQHELTFETWPHFISTRCSDGNIVHGKLMAVSQNRQMKM